PDPDALLRKVVPDDKRYTLVARVTGPAKSAYPDGPPAKPEAKQDEAPAKSAPAAPHLAESKGPIAVIVGADSDLFDDRFWVQVQDFFGQRILVPIADNATLLINALDNLAGSDALIALRGRGVRDRPFVVVNAIRRDAEARFLAEQERLKQELATTEQRLKDLQAKMGESERVLTPEQEQELARFRARTLEIRQQLRAVQRNLVRDIEALETRLVILNVVLVPALLTLIALSLAAWRRRRRRRRVPA
ncbi:MAG: ABC transporter, partial [Alphaproteobacteria bacterium]